MVYDPRYHTWDSWSSLMCEAYAGQQLAMNVPENLWRNWADGLNAVDSFMNEAVPSPQVFDSWQGWASALAGAVNERSA